MKRIVKDRKFLIGLALSLVLAMAVGSFAISEVQTEANPQVAETNADTGDFVVSGDATDYSFDGTTLTIHGTHTISMAPTATLPTSQRILIDNTADITLDNVKIETSSGAALEIADDAMFNVKITLANESENTLTTTANSCAALQKGNNQAVTTCGELTITGKGTLKAIGGRGAAGIGGKDGGASGCANGSKIYISNGANVEAHGGEGAAGIGGGYYGSGSEIEISDSTVTAFGSDAVIESDFGYGFASAGIGGGDGGNGDKITITNSTVTVTGGSGATAYDPSFFENMVCTAAAAIGGGGGFYCSGLPDFNEDPGTGSDNHLTGNSILIATGGNDGEHSKDPLDGFDETSRGSLDSGIIFVQKTDSDVSEGRVYGNVVLSQDLEIPANLTIPAGNTLSIEEGKTVILSEKSGAKYTVEGTLKNDGTVTLPTDIEVKYNGAITTKTNFYLTDGSKYGDEDYYQTYQTSEGQQKYKDLPNPDVTKLLRSSLNTDRFAYWYYLNEEEKEVAIKDGDDGTNVLLNQHDFYESREETHTITTSKEGEGEISINVTEAYEGDEVTFTVTPAEGYELKEGSVSVKAGEEDVVVTDQGEGKYIFEMPGAAVQVSAVFEQIPEPTPTPPGPGPEPTPDPSVDPDGDGGSGSGASSKTSDPFMGGIALALLGVATTGAVLVRKRK